jgi:hypothetical protein
MTNQQTEVLAHLRNAENYAIGATDALAAARKASLENKVLKLVLTPVWSDASRVANLINSLISAIEKDAAK